MQNDYKEQALQKTPQKVQKKYEKSEAPGFIETSYHRDYQSLAGSPALSAKRAEVRLMGGGRLSSDTTYNQYYRTKTMECVEAPRPIIHKEYSFSHPATRSSSPWPPRPRPSTAKTSQNKPRSSPLSPAANPSITTTPPRIN